MDKCFQMGSSFRSLQKTKEFSCTYCGLLWLAACKSIFPLQEVRKKKYCVICAHSEHQSIIFVRVPPTSFEEPCWFKVFLRACDFYCCDCKDNVNEHHSLSKNRYGLIQVVRHKGTKFHRLCKHCYDNRYPNFLPLLDNCDCLK